MDIPLQGHDAVGIGSTENRRRVWAIIGGSSGNLVEWYDFYVYSFTALYFASEFFPAGDQTTQLLNAAAVFAAGFLMRPIGSWFFGRIADKRGRRVSMMIAVSMMCAGSLMVAVLPTYTSIGLAAPTLLLLARLVQGLSVGGEYGTSATYMSEVALKGHRGFFASPLDWSHVKVSDRPPSEAQREALLQWLERGASTHRVHEDRLAEAGVHRIFVAAETISTTVDGIVTDTARLRRIIDVLSRLAGPR